MTNLNSSDKDFLDAINDSDIVIESKRRDDIHHLGLLHREVHVWFFDKNHNIYFQERGMHKSSAGLLDASIGGHVDKGEEYISSAIREGQEESGISMLASDLILLTKFRGNAKNTKEGTTNNFFRSVYIYKNPVTDTAIKCEENHNFKKFSISFLLNMSKQDTMMFCKFVPTHELPFVFKYLNNL